MSKQLETNTDSPDPILFRLSEASEPIITDITKDPDYALFVLGIKLTGEGDKSGGVQTYANIAGMFDVLAEGLYAEMANQIEGGDMTLYSLLREVLSDLEEDFEIDPNRNL